MGLSNLIASLYKYTLGGTAPSGAASASGDISQMVKYLTANITLNPNAVEVYPRHTSTLGFSGTGAWGTRAGPAASSSDSGGVSTPTNSIAFHPDGTFVAATISASPYVLVWNFSSSGFGSKLSNPGTLPANSGQGVAFHPNGNWLAVIHQISPYLTVYAFDKVGASIGAKVSDPASLPAGTPNGVAFSPDGNYLAVVGASSPYVEVYNFNSNTGAIGAKVSNPGTLPTGTGNGVAWSKSGAYIAVGHDTSPFISVYPWSAGFGTKFANPGTLPTSNGAGVAWVADERLFLCEASSPYLHGWAFSSAGFGTKYSNPASLPPGACYGISITPFGNYVVVASATTPYVVAYPLGEAAFGTKLSDPASLPGANTKGVAIRQTETSLHVVANSSNGANSQYNWPFTQVGYIWTPTLATLAKVQILVETANIRLVPKISGTYASPILTKFGYATEFGIDLDALFIGPDNDGGTGKFKVIASGR